MDLTIDWAIPALFLGGLFYFYRKNSYDDAPIMIVAAAIFWPVTLAYFCIEIFNWIRRRKENINERS